MNWRVLETLELQARVLRTLFAVIVFKRLRVGQRKIAFHGLPTGGGFDQHKPPGLAVPNGWRVAGKFEQRMDQGRIDRIAPKASNVAAPNDEIAERLAEFPIELRRWIVRLRHAAAPSMTWKNVPVVVPCRKPCSGTWAPEASLQSTSESPRDDTVLA